jgi:phage repressor protein C with HTH and peptisase S24 domain
VQKASSLAITERERTPINLVAADIWFQDPELAGLAVVPICGDSMQPTFRSGDYALVDTRQTEVAGGGIFAILENNRSVIVKQVEEVHYSQAGRIRCTPRNPAYTAFELTLGEEAEIIGRVIQKITRHL